MTLLTINTKYVVQSTTAFSTSSATLVADNPSSNPPTKTFSLSATQTVLVIYNANAGPSDAGVTTGFSNAIGIDGTSGSAVHSQMYCSQYAATGPNRNCCFWVGSLASGSHTVTGLVATNTTGTVVISNRTLLVYVFNGDEFRYLENSTSQTYSAQAYTMDGNVDVSVTPSGPATALAMYYATNNPTGTTEITQGKGVSIGVGASMAAIPGMSAFQAANASNAADSATTFATITGISGTNTYGGMVYAQFAGTVTVSKSAFAILFFDANTTQITSYLDSTTGNTPSTTSLVNEPSVTTSLTPVSYQTELLVLAKAEVITASPSSGIYYGVNINSTDYAQSRYTLPINNGAGSCVVAYGMTVTAGTPYTINGRYALNVNGSSCAVTARYLAAIWFTFPGHLASIVSGTGVAIANNTLFSVIQITISVFLGATSSSMGVLKQTYVCDGMNDDVQINAALAYANSLGPSATNMALVYLPGGYTYDIQSPLIVYSFTIIKMDNSTKLLLNPNPSVANFPSGKAMLYSSASIQNVEIYGGEINGNKANLANPATFYPGYQLSGIVFASINNLNVHNLKITNLVGFGIYVGQGSNIIIQNNVFSLTFCSCICLLSCVPNLGLTPPATLGASIFSNNITVSGRSDGIIGGIKIYDCANVTINNNYITGWVDPNNTLSSDQQALGANNSTAATQHGIIVIDDSGVSVNIVMFLNVILNIYGVGVMISETGNGASQPNKNLLFYTNQVQFCGGSTVIDYNCGVCLQGFNGARFYSNSVSNCFHAGVLVNFAPVSCSQTVYFTNNNICHTRCHYNPAFRYAWSGCGCCNLVPTQMALVMLNNVLADNNENYYGITSVNDYQVVASVQPYVPPVSYMPNPAKNYYIPGYSAYINGYPFRWQNKKINVKKSIAQEHPPGTDGFCIEDFGFEGCDVTLDCYSYSLNEMRQVIQAFYTPSQVTGLSVLELGGIYTGWGITGICASHSTDIKLSTLVPQNAYPYNVLFIADKPIMQSMTPTVRTKILTDRLPGGSWISNDSLAEDVINNGDFHCWYQNAGSDWPWLPTNWDVSVVAGWFGSQLWRSPGIQDPNKLSFGLNGDGTTNKVGGIQQFVQVKPNIPYILTSCAATYNMGTAIAFINIYDTDGALLMSNQYTGNSGVYNWTTLTDTYTFSTSQPFVQVKIFGGDVSNGGVMPSNSWCMIDFVSLQPGHQYDDALIGTNITTTGTVNVTPNIYVEATNMQQCSAALWTEGFNTAALDNYQISYTTATYTLIKEYRLWPADGWRRYRIDHCGIRHRCVHGCTVTTYVEYSVYSSSDGNNPLSTTTISTWSRTCNDDVTWFLESTNPYITHIDRNQEIRIRFWGKCSITTGQAFWMNPSYSVTDIYWSALNTPSLGVQIWNQADPLKILQLSNQLYPGMSIAINNDGTGSFEYKDCLQNITYQTISWYDVNATMSGMTTTYPNIPVQNSVINLLTLASNGWVIYYFDTRYPITGIPYLQLDLCSGNPYVYIAPANCGISAAVPAGTGTGTLVSGGGNNGTNYSSFGCGFTVNGSTIYTTVCVNGVNKSVWWPVDMNSTSAPNCAYPYCVELDNAANMSLKGQTQFYVLIWGNPSCIINSIYLYTDIVTIDAEIPQILVGGPQNLADGTQITNQPTNNTFLMTMPGIGSTVNRMSVKVTLRYQDAHRMI